jgi:hypothetical protein
MSRQVELSLSSSDVFDTLKGNIFGHNKDNIFQKQTDFIKEMTLLTISSENIKEHVEQLQNNVKCYLESAQLNTNNYSSWTRAGWYIAQKGSLHNILQKQEKIMCFNCQTIIDNADSINNNKIKYCYILSEKGIPSFMLRKFIRAYVICTDCVSSAIFPPPKTWSDALVSSIYHNETIKIDKLTHQFSISATVKTLNDTSTALLNQKAELETIVTETGNQIKYLDTKIAKHNDIIEQRNNLMGNMIKERMKIHDAFKNEEDIIKNKFDVIELNILSTQTNITDKLTEMRNTITDEINNISCTSHKSIDQLKAQADIKTFNADICQVCYDSPIDIVLDPCGHLVICSGCKSYISGSCPLCRKRITKTFKIYKA